MKWLALCLCVWPAFAHAQSREVLPRELELRVEVEATPYRPFVHEMVLITIHGTYRRHITRESLVQPDFAGFSWTQLGDDLWLDERIDGEAVKTFRRRMAIYPDQAGQLEIGSFTHNLTLTDEGDDWFDHQIASDPVRVEVAPPPAGQDWWFPVRSLEITDNWSNAPDQLSPGEGVLRIIRVGALGATPEMFPPMPQLVSPSGMIFAHPEKRLVELTPDGPISFAYWRYTIQPGNDTSTIVEPISFDYFDSTTRTQRTATITAQRVAYGTVVPDNTAAQTGPEVVQSRLPGWPLGLLAGAVFAGALAIALSGRRLVGLSALQRFPSIDPLARRMRRAARTGDVRSLRQTASAVLVRDGAQAERVRMLSELDRQIFNPAVTRSDLRAFTGRFLDLS